MTEFLNCFTPEILDIKLLQCIKQNDTDNVTVVLEQGANPNAIVDNKHIILCVDDTDILEILIKYGANVNIVDNNSTYLELCILDGRMDLVKILIENFANIRNLPIGVLDYIRTYFEYDKTVQTFLAYTFNPKILNTSLLFSTRLDMDAIEKFKDYLDFNYVHEGENPVTYRIKNLGKSEGISDVEFLLQNGSDPNFLYKDKTNILAYTNNIYVLDLLAEYNININNVDIYGNTPLFYSTYAYFTHKLIRDHKANFLHINNNGEDFLFMVDNIYSYDVEYCLDNGLKFNTNWLTYLRDDKFLEAVDGLTDRDTIINIAHIIDKYTDINTIIGINDIGPCKYKTIRDIVDKKEALFVRYYLTRYPSIIENTFESLLEKQYFYSIINELYIPECVLKRAILLSYHNDDLKILFYLKNSSFDPFIFIKDKMKIEFDGRYLAKITASYLIPEDAKKLFKTESSILKYIDLNGSSEDLLRFFGIENNDCLICLCPLDDKIAYSNCCKRASFIHLNCFERNMTRCIICRRDADYYTDDGFCSYRL